MGNAQNVKATSQDAYMHQKMYEEKRGKNKKSLSWVFLAISIFSLISVFIFPLYEYSLAKKTDFPIVGKYTSVKMISEYFSKGFGEYSFLNTITMISTVLLIATMVYIVIAAVITVCLKGKINGWVRKLTSFTGMEIVAALQLVLLIINMIAAKVDVSGNASNGIEFWIIFVTSFLLIFFSISLSSPDSRR